MNSFKCHTIYRNTKIVRYWVDVPLMIVTEWTTCKCDIYSPVLSVVVDMLGELVLLRLNCIKVQLHKEQVLALHL